jgi:magnesium transporter
MTEALPDKIEEVTNQSDLYSNTSDTATVLAQADKVELALLPESIPIQKRLFFGRPFPIIKSLMY